ncbi:hypothetical protein EG68_02514 [Paragonimus skrjabini miyazakii]|uniref:UPF0506 domain-containing protein n=1 Tax=Paragonimus skrjabini miyazakii TaxID=59628 RepID=A0A8S9Z394_9TREM|nr:hypothetical protein EG68_02514 [Paragonimus skrjabini miyazakii]
MLQAWLILCVLLSVTEGSAVDFFKPPPTDCYNAGQLCTWSVFNKCCPDLVCELRYGFTGICSVCLRPGNFCVKDRQCCNNKCYYMACL